MSRAPLRLGEMHDPDRFALGCFDSGPLVSAACSRVEQARHGSLNKPSGRAGKRPRTITVGWLGWVSLTVCFGRPFVETGVSVSFGCRLSSTKSDASAPLVVLRILLLLRPHESRVRAKALRGVRAVGRDSHVCVLLDGIFGSLSPGERSPAEASASFGWSSCRQACLPTPPRGRSSSSESWMVCSS